MQNHIPSTSYHCAPLVIPPLKCSGGHAFPFRINGCALEYTVARCLNKALSGEGLSIQHSRPVLLKNIKIKLS